MAFTEIDMKTWPKAAQYRHFSKINPMRISVTATVDITHLLAVCREKNIKFTAAMLWLVTEQANRYESFRIEERNGKPVLYDELHTVFPVMHEDDHSLSHLWIERERHFAVFYENYRRIIEAYGDERRFLARRDKVRPENVLVVSYLPWLNFTSFSVQTTGQTVYLAPSVEWGKYTEDEKGTVSLPVSLTAHHATVDGWQISQFFLELQEACDTFFG